ncbi:MAG: dihydropteroate synthase [Candidatus Latescibacterota bacterium]|nr:MAG: dihydropteroate synthase [Candidatus Latescibacterota bacterium]
MSELLLPDGRKLPLDRALIMGVLNVTPDSFSDGGLFLRTEDAVRRAEEMAQEGADIIDIGGESSRPGAEPVPLEEELRRVIPVVREVARRLSVPISIDTYKAEVARRALEEGASIVNDISALRFDPDMAEVVARRRAPVVLMHMKGTPRDMQRNPYYEDVLGEVEGFLKERKEAAVGMGIPEENIILDPGIGFGKRVQDNLQLLKNLDRLVALGSPVLVGTSRKSFIGAVLDLPVEERLEGTLATLVLAVAKGAKILRVHDVRPAVRVVRMAEAVLRA